MRSNVAIGTMLVGVALLITGLPYVVQRNYHAEPEQKAKRTTLLKEALAGVQGKEAQVKHMEFPPGWVGSKHYHPGHVFVYVLEGTFIVDVEGTTRRTVGPGEVFHELPGSDRVMQARNGSAADWVKILVFQVGDEGTPITVKVK
jgi:quercetin dioxygenase-like cupin family protein